MKKSNSRSQKEMGATPPTSGLVRRKTTNNISKRDNRMLSMFQMYKVIGNLVKLRHIDRLIIYGILATVKPSIPQKICIAH
jgi:hypothetical protein